MMCLLLLVLVAVFVGIVDDGGDDGDAVVRWVRKPLR